MSKHLHPEDRLAILQAADTHRKWYSLDDQRVCVLCDRLITGRQIDVTLDKRGNPKLQCPTPGCPATPHDWFYHGNAVAAQNVTAREDFNFL